MGCYGIGIGRTMAAIVEAHHDDKGITWPASIAPALVYIARLSDSSGVVDAADELYREVLKAGIDVLYDDRDVRAGEKFADADLLGIPYRIVVSEKTVAAKQYELKSRASTDVQVVDLGTLLKTLAANSHES
jgi:prolyl-tRNA synthetase